MSAPLYLDTSAVLRVVLETGTTPQLERRLRDAEALVTSRLSLVESARALIRLRALGTLDEPQIAYADRSLDAVWRRCEIWEIDRAVCELAQAIAPATALRSLDALHLATFHLARRQLDGLELLTVDERLRAAAGLA